MTKSGTTMQAWLPGRTPDLRERQNEYISDALMLQIREALMLEIQKRYAYLTNTQASYLCYG
jgi:hypothetical protein